MFTKILIANRGEIAVRVIRTCRRLHIGTVAVYSDADERSLHVRLADESVHIGPAPARESYLVGRSIIEAALSTGCRAIHPGYGFLSESAAFAEAVAAAGLVFIGPPAAAIGLMGDKIASKELAVKAGVPVIPGHTRPLRDLDEALRVAEEIGFPVLLKPSAGGGGKGMRIVREPGEMESALTAGRSEALKAFGDDRIFMERYIVRPRHVEIQVLADSHGNVVHLGERECSIQRRYQKVIEESPSPAVSPDLRRRMGQAACDLARQVGYVNAGTVEFVLDPEGHFYFLEMNTRLQVEHPVTEMVTGFDLVELQLRIAAGDHLPFSQEEVIFNGWAMEARICAEKPENDFLPSTGMITRYAEPRGKGIRVDSGVETGSMVGINYDSMLAKVICWGADRDEARKRLVEALDGYHIEGVDTNIDFVNAVLGHQEFARGNLSTDFIPEHFEGSRSRTPPDREALQRLVIASTLVFHGRMMAVRESVKPMTSQIGTAVEEVEAYRYYVRSENDLFEVMLEEGAGSRHWKVSVDERNHDVLVPEFEFFRRRLRLTIDGHVHRFRLRQDAPFMAAAHSGVNRRVEVYTPREWELIHHMPKKVERRSENVLVCPMPGLVVEVRVAKGDRVYRGQDLLILESMKLETGVASPRDAVVEEVLVRQGDSVEMGTALLRFAARETGEEDILSSA